MIRLLGAGMVALALVFIAVSFLMAGPQPVFAQPAREAAHAPFPYPPASDATSSWSAFQPADWVTTSSPTCTVTVQDSLGLQETTAQYRYSTNAGVSWSGWSSAGLSVGGTLSTTKYLTVTGVVFGESGTNNLIQFTIQDTNGDPDTSPAFLVKVDSQAPAAPANLAASPSTWTNNNDFRLNWVNPTDTSGVAGAYYRLDTPPASPTDGTLIAGTHITSLEHLTVSGSGAHTVYLWLRDAAGNADHAQRSTAVLYYDQDAPAGPTTLTSTTHIVSTWSQDNYVQVTWDGAFDGASGIGGYAVAWDESPTTLPVPITTTVEHQAMSPALADGDDHYVHVRTVDRAGNWTLHAAHLGPFYIDRTAPAAPLSLTADPITWTNINQFDLNWTNPADLSGIAGAYYRLDTPPAFGSDGTWVAGEDIHSLQDISASGNGAHPIYIWLKDKAGNVLASNRASTTLYLDTIRPGAPTNLIPEPAGWSNDPTFSISWTNPSDISGIAGAYYKLNAEPTSSSDGIWVTTTNRIDDIPVPGEGQHDIYIWLKDNAGNTDHRTRNVLLKAFKYDGTAPTTTHVLTGTLGENGWYVSPVDVGLSAFDALSGVDHTTYRVNSGAWQSGTALHLTAAGVYTVEYRSLDRAGNEEAPHPLPVKIDSAPPTTSLSLEGTAGLNGWYVSPVTVTFLVEDSVSGPAATHYRLDGGAWQSGPSLLIDNDGIHELEYYSVDRAGNQESPASRVIRVDFQPPITLYTMEGTAGDGNWFRSPVSVTLTPTDLASGPVATYYRLDAAGWISGTKVAVTSEGTHSLKFYSRDAAGNQEAPQDVGVNIDMTPPLPPFGLAAQPTGWSRTNAFTLTWISLADPSGIAGAYYKLDGEPSHPADGTYVAGATSHIAGIQVPGEGKHSIYLWLRDGAGNANQLTRNVLIDALWLDITPPTSTHTLSGSLGQNGWYTSSVRVRLSAVDALSGVDHFYHWVYGMGDWTEGSAFDITTSGRHTMQYYAVDAAGNEETPRVGFVRVDLEAPPAPLNLRSEQVGWQSENSFSVSWTDPADTSLIGAAYYKLDAPPTAPQDGVRVDAPLGRISNIAVPVEGKHAIYVWLVDNAGNRDHTHYAMVNNAFWYDAHPPTTTHTITGTLGYADWYLSPVSITLQAEDAGSGVVGTVYRVDGGAWQAGHALSIQGDGIHTLQYYSTDQAGNNEPLRSVTIKIDTRPPSSMVSSPTTVYQEDNVFTVAWSGMDPTPGSGLLGFDVQYKQGAAGSWVDWRTATDELSGLFAGQRGRIYYFRSRARDRAGNQEAYPAGNGDRMVYIEPVANGRFETRDLSFWATSGPMGKRVEEQSTHDGGRSYTAVLGNPELGPCYDTQQPPPALPVGSGTISQTVYVPASPDVVVPKLHFWYHMMTYDVVWSERFQRYYDSFDVEISVGGGPRQLLLRDGNFDPALVGAGRPVVDLGWRRAEIDLSPYAGQTVTLYFSNSNRQDNYFNTWTYLDDISITDSVTGYKVYLPLVDRAVSGTVLGSARRTEYTGPR